MNTADQRKTSTQPQEPAPAAQRRAEALRRAAQAKRKNATARAEVAIRQLVKNQQEINFRSVARAGNVSLDFLYANPDLRPRIERLRAQQTTQTPSAPAGPNPSETDGNIAHVLAGKLREERAARRTAVRDLEDRLAASHGEILRLRRILQQHGIHT